MGKLKRITNLLIMMVGLTLIFTLCMTKITFAADENSLDDFFTTSSGNTSSGTASGSNNDDDDDDDEYENVPSTNSNTSNSLTTNNNTANNTANNTNTNNSAVNRSVANTNSLASTGLSDHSGAMILIVVIGGISAIYSFKKINDYKNI